MINIGKKICLDPLVWGSKSEKEFLETFKNGASVAVLKRAYADLPKPEKEVKKKRITTTKEIVADLEKAVDLSKEFLALNKKKDKDG